MALCVKRFVEQEGRAFSYRMLHERTDGLPSIGFLDADTDSLGSDVTLDEG